VRDNLHRIVEAILFASDVPISQQKFKELISGTGVKDIRDAIQYLNRQYEEGGSALKIIEIAGGYQIVTREEYAPYLQKLYKGRTASRLTQRALETLSIVAYKQPITKQEIESIRGVNVDAVIKTLLERNLISIEGRQKAPGSPLLYGTTRYFLEYFALNSLDALPKLKEIDDLLKADDKFLESLDLVALEKLAPESLGLKNPETLTAEAKDQKEAEGKQIPLIAFGNGSGQEAEAPLSPSPEITPPREQANEVTDYGDSEELSQAEPDRTSDTPPGVTGTEREPVNPDGKLPETKEPVSGDTPRENKNDGQKDPEPGVPSSDEKNSAHDEIE
jgi:segregation and condensation protein B